MSRREAKIKDWYGKLEQSLQRMDRDIAYNKKVAAIQNLQYEPSEYTLERYADCKLGLNDIDAAKANYGQYAQIMLKSLQSPEGLLPGLRGSYDLPFNAYLGGNREILVRFSCAVLPEIEAGRHCYDDFQKFQKCLVLSYFVGDRARTERYVRALEERIDAKGFVAGGSPKPGGGHRLSIGHALYYKEMIRALLSKDAEKFTESMNGESEWGFDLLMREEFYDMVDKELTVLYDIALGEGMRPKPDTPFIPKAVLENGYWNHP